MAFGRSRYGSHRYGTQPYAGETRAEAAGISATLAGTSSLSVDMGAALAISASLEGVGALGAIAQTPIPIGRPPGLVVRWHHRRIGVRR